MTGRMGCALGILLVAVQPLVDAVVLSGCTSQGWIEIDETASRVPITCEELGASDDVTWQVRTPQSAPAFTVIGVCRPDGTCTDSRLSRPDSATSTLTLTPSRQQGKYDVQCSQEGAKPAECQLNIVYPPSDSEVSCSIAPSSSSRWEVTASCNVTKAFSSRNHYTCDLRQGEASDSSVATSNYSSGSGDNFISGTCTLPAAMPTTTGNYSYTVIISPGQKAVTLQNSITVARPSADPVITCVTAQGQYVPENSNLNCNCSASDLGHPKGRLRVYRGNSEKISGSYGEVRVAFSEASVSRDDDGAVFRCVVEWATTDSPRNTSFTLHVAYGPSSANLAQPSVFDLHPTSPGSLTLICSAAEVQPSVRYSWTGSRCVGVTQSTCSFTPTTNDDDDTISCTAINTVTSASKTSVTRTLRINYPPSNAPEITGYTEGDILFAGQNRSMTCTVSGGNPVVSAVTFTCDSQSQEVSGAISTLSITASRDYNGRRCSCGARWKNTDTSWYPFTAGVNITVYYPPDVPTIGHKDQPYPFLAGESPRLYCSLPAGPGSGNPPAFLTFAGHRGRPGQGEVSLNLGPLDETDNGRRMTCEANNAFTDHTNTSRTQGHVLQVYYLTQPTLTPLSNDTCDVTSADTCVVREGGRVHVNCTARSNPPIHSIAWQQSGNNVLDLVANRTLPVSYACNVTTETVDSDDRLPLNNKTVLTILPTYAAEIDEFTANRLHQNITINESSILTLNCTAMGRPTPGMIITKDGQPIQRVPKGDPVTEIQTSILTYHRSNATCDVTGDYVCEVDNDLGGQSSNRLTMLVNCSPRRAPGYQEPEEPLNFIGEPLMVQFTLIAFPAELKPTLNYFKYLNSTPETARKTLYKFNCMENTLFQHNCTLIVENVTQADTGFYNLTLMNYYGEYSWRFELDVNASIPAGESSKQFPIGAAVGGGVAAALVVILVIAVVILTLKRRKKEKEAAKKDSHRLRQTHSRNREDGDDEMIVNTIYESSDTANGDAEMIVNTLYETSDSRAPHTRNSQLPSGNTYEDVNFAGSVAMDRPSGATPVADNASLYASVDKSKKSVPPVLSKNATDSVRKPGVKPKHQKKGKQDSLGKKKEQEKEVYSNTALLSMKPQETSVTVYENCGFVQDEASAAKKPESSEISPSANPDGLVYTTIAFTRDQQKKAKQPPPERETTEYVDIDFGKLVRKSD